MGAPCCYHSSIPSRTQKGRWVYDNTVQVLQRLSNKPWSHLCKQRQSGHLLQCWCRLWWESILSCFQRRCTENYNSEVVMKQYNLAEKINKMNHSSRHQFILNLFCSKENRDSYELKRIITSLLRRLHITGLPIYQMDRWEAAGKQQKCCSSCTWKWSDVVEQHFCTLERKRYKVRPEGKKKEGKTSVNVWRFRGSVSNFRNNSSTYTDASQHTLFVHLQ